MHICDAIRTKMGPRLIARNAQRSAKQLDCCRAISGSFIRTNVHGYATFAPRYSNRNSRWNCTSMSNIPDWTWKFSVKYANSGENLYFQQTNTKTIAFRHVLIRFLHKPHLDFAFSFRLKHKVCLNKHMRTHRDSPAVCPYCGKMSQSQRGLKEHIKLQHTNYASTIKCNVCEKSFKHKHQLKVYFSINSRQLPLIYIVFFFRSTWAPIAVKRTYIPAIIVRKRSGSIPPGTLIARRPIQPNICKMW